MKWILLSATCFIDGNHGLKLLIRQKRYFIGPQQILNSLNQFRPFFVKISVLSVLVSVFDSNHRIDVAMEQGNPRKTRYSFEKVLTLPVKLHQRFIVLKASLDHRRHVVNALKDKSLCRPTHAGYPCRLTEGYTDTKTFQIQKQHSAGEKFRLSTLGNY